ncbi:MAG: DNA-3-methyladenine glycosylase 2 family protein [Clostridia bacterium]|nr:DNA-3-methyladenine glycosylase 2 family protein [Clostridia bacterium]
MVYLKETEKSVSCVRLDGVSDFDVGKIFDCGQCFRFDTVESSSHEVEFSGVAYGRLISVAQDGQTVYIYNSTQEDFENIWRRFLGLDEDYGAIAEDILSRSDNPALGRAVGYGRGIRILRQEPWETICSFIISQNNNIPRIKKIIGALAQKCGEPIAVPEGMRTHLSESTVPYAFPTPDSLCALGIDGLFELKTGFRAKYIYDAASRAAMGNIDYSYLENSDDTAECVRELCAIKGVGPKVASCALLFGFGRYDAFPVDVWIKKVIQKYFSADGGDFSPAVLGPYAGIAQQFLFYYERYLA